VCKYSATHENVTARVQTHKLAIIVPDVKFTIVSKRVFVKIKSVLLPFGHGGDVRVLVGVFVIEVIGFVVQKTVTYSYRFIRKFIYSIKRRIGNVLTV
jgi:hypothetical protein